jgi:MFS family permease
MRKQLPEVLDTQTPVPPGTAIQSRAGWALFAWLLAALCYFFQYVLRTTPGVMMPQLRETFGLSAAGAASLAGLFYYGYSAFGLVAGTSIDRFGPKRVVAVGVGAVAVGALLFGTGNLILAQFGRFIQGAGGVFAMIGAVYLAGRATQASMGATMVGATQMFGASGGAAGQFLVGPMIAAGLVWTAFFRNMGVVGLVLAAAALVLLPKKEPGNQKQEGWLKSVAGFTMRVFRKPQTILCGLIAGLFFVPTTVFDMIWGVRFLQEGHGFDYGEAVIRSATVPLGWLIGSPFMGLISDRLGRRKPVLMASGCGLIACLAWILYGWRGLFPPYVIGITTGILSGAGMLLYTMGKEGNPPELGGTITGAISFQVFLFSALMNAVFGRITQTISGGTELVLEQYQVIFRPLLYGVGLAVVLTLALKETGRSKHAVS